MQFLLAVAIYQKCSKVDIAPLARPAYELWFNYYTYVNAFCTTLILNCWAVGCLKDICTCSLHPKKTPNLLLIMFSVTTPHYILGY